MADPVMAETKAPGTTAWPAVAYLVLVGVILGFAILVRTAGAAMVMPELRRDADVTAYDRHGVELGRFHLESNVLPVTLEQMSPILVDAILIALDHDYLETEKTDTWPLIVSALDGSFLSLTPSITQLYVRLHNGVPKTRMDALREVSSVIYLERVQQKEATFEEYLSQVPLGRNTYGVEAASLAWYGRTSDKLEISQAAHLASLISNGVLPRTDKAHRGDVLLALNKEGLITDDELLTQRQVSLADLLNPIEAASPKNQMVSGIGLRVPLQKIYRNMLDIYGRDALLRGDIEAISTIDFDLQTRVADVVGDAMSKTEIQEAVVVVLDDRNQIRAAYGSEDRLFDRDLAQGRTIVDLFGLEVPSELFSWPNEITVFQLGEYHSVFTHGGRRYETTILLETRARSGETIDRFSHDSSRVIDAETALRVTQQLDDFLFVNQTFGLADNEIPVKGKLGIDSKRRMAWFAGASSRFTVSLWVTAQFDSTNSEKQSEANRVFVEREAQRLIRKIFGEAHKEM